VKDEVAPSEISKVWQAPRGHKIDTMLVWKFNRIAQSTKQLIDSLEEFRHLGGNLIPITEQIDTSSSMFERSLICERVMAKIVKAHRRQAPRATEDES